MAQEYRFPMQSLASRLEIVDALLESLPFFVAEVESGQIVYTSGPFEALLGYKMRWELVGRNVSELLPPADREHFEALRADYAARPEPRSLAAGQRVTGLHRDGHAVRAAVAITPRVIAGRRCAIVVLVGVDDPG